MRRLAFILPLALATATLAAPIRVAVLTTSQVKTSADAGLLVGAARALEAAPELAPVDTISMFDPRSADDAIADAVASAEAAFDQLELARAVEEGERAVGLAVTLGQPEVLPRAFMVLLQARLAVDDKAGALQTARLWHQVQRPPAFEAAKARPTLRGLMETAAKPGKPVGALRVDSTIPGLVRLDGRPIGITPVFLDQLPTGPHLVSLDVLGHARWMQWVTVPETIGVEVLARPRPAARGRLLDDIHALLPSELERDQAGRGLRDVRALFAAEQAVLIEARAGRAIASLFDLQASRRVRSVRVELDTDAIAAGEALVEGLYARLDPSAPGLAAPEEAPPVDDSPPYWTRWWFWPAVATAAIAAVAVPLALFEDDEQGLKRVDDAGALIIRF